MGRSDTDWKNVFLSYFSHDGAVGASSDDSPAPAPQAPAAPGNELERHFGTDPQVDDGTLFRLTRAPAAKAAAGLGPDVDVPSASKGLGPDVLPSASKGVHDFSPVDEDEQGEHAVSREHCSKLSPKFSGEKQNNGKLPLNKRKSQGHGGKKKPRVTKRKAHTTNSEESDYESSLPTRFSKRRKQQLQNSSSVRKVQDVILLDDEDMEYKEEVNREMNEPKIYYPSRDDQEAVELNRSNIKCLNPREFLSSPVINFYIKYIKMTRLCNEDFRDKFYIFNTYFFGKLEEALYQPRDFPKLRRWWKGVNIFNNAYIILPIHKKEHWSLVIICLPSKERISEPIILHLDSLEMHRSTNILNTVGRYLETEWRFLSIAEPAWPPLLSNIRKETVQVPQQDNAYDCGIFMLYYIEQFIKEAPARFTADKLDMLNHSWFKPKEASRLRQRVRELLLVEFESATRLDNAISKEDVSKGYDNIKKDKELEADDSSKMVVEVGGGLGNIVKSNGGMKVASSEEASEESRNVVKSIQGMKVAETEEAREVFRDVAKSVEGINVAGLENTMESNGGMKVVTSEEASGESRNAVKSFEGMNVAEPEEASEVSRDATKSVEGISVAGLGNTMESNGGMKVAASEKASGECQNVVKSIDEGIKVAELEEASEVSRDAYKRLEGISVSVAELDEASGASGDTGKSKTNNKDIKAISASGEASVESGYPANKSMEDHIADVAVVNKGGPTPTSSNNKCNEKNTGCVVSEATSCSDSVKDKKGTNSGCSKAEKEGKSTGTASSERLKGTDDDEAIGSSTPMTIQDTVSDSGVKRSEGNNEEAIGSMVPVPGTIFCEISGTAMWITRVYRPEIRLPLDNWCSCRDRSSRDDDDARRALIKQFCGKSSNKN